LTSAEFTPPPPQHQATPHPAPPHASSGQRCAGLYAPIPFCFHKCHYCDFYSIVDHSAGAGSKHTIDRQTPFAHALFRELEYRAEQHQLQPETIFIGGGTPTLMRTDLWRQLLQTMRALGVLRRTREFTVEANPETVTPELLDVLARGGVNRLSMGAQTFQPRLLETLQRWHDPASIGKAMQGARAAGITNLSLDLIFAIPGQTDAELDADLDAALELEPTHLSCYSLIFEPETPLAMKRKLGRVAPTDEDTERRMYQRVIDRLHEAGYEQYEISNWALRSSNGHGASFRCLHNLLYWTNRDWIGVGPSAASHAAGERWKNVPHLGRYVAGSPTPPVQDVEQLDEDARRGEALMLGLRLREGVTHDWLNDTLPADNPRRAIINQLIDQHMLERTDTHLRLTDEGLFLADAVMSRLL